MNNDSEIIRKVKQWTSFGDDDLKLAKHALNLSTGSRIISNIYEIICGHQIAPRASAAISVIS